jgi:DNA mismatch repair protein MutL
MSSIKKLDPNLVDQIAAGEVVGRPASVVKELVENSIDAGADKIEIAIEDGGKKSITIKDNGLGMSVEDLEVAVESHTTSKIDSLEDIINIRTLGFRGEALSSIASVSKMKIASLEKGGDKAYKVSVDGGEKSEPEITSRNRGTTIAVEDIFYNVPARRKFLKTDKTEYRKVLEVFSPIALINPQVHFILKSDGREVYNLPSVNDVNQGAIHPDRLSELFKDIEFVELFYDGESITVGGVVAHPRHHKSRTRNRYVFVNGRPVWDSGIVKAVSVGASRFIPATEKVPFAISVNVSPKYVDVNVHPQKSEVRFSNPYRVYSAVEKAVKASYEKDLQEDESDAEFARFRKDGVRQGLSHTEAKDIDTRKVYDSQDSLRFSRMVLEDSRQAGKSSADKQQREDTEVRSFFDSEVAESKGAETAADGQPSFGAPTEQFLNRYIVTQRGSELWIVDQHAAAERIRFETLLDNYENKSIESQMLMDIKEIELSKGEVAFVNENKETLEQLGYSLEIDDSSVKLKAVPALLQGGDHESVIMEILDELEQIDDFADKQGILRGKYRDSVIATMACHSSVRMNRKLARQEADGIVRDLMRCRNSYSCPHGRPIIWKLSPKEIEKHFER